MLEAGAEVNWRNHAGETALLLSAGKLGRTRDLLAAGTDPNIRSKKGLSPLQHTVTLRSNKEATEIVQALIAAGADSHEGDDTILMAASRKGSPEVVKVLAAAGVDLNSVTSYGTAADPGGEGQP